MYWYDFSGNLWPYGVIQPGGGYTQVTWASHPWTALGVNGSESEFTLNGLEALVPDAGDNKKTFII